jgi:hypothetical protein
MRNMIRGCWNFKLYLPPVLLLATAGALLMGLLYYPAPSTHGAGDRQALVVTDKNHGRMHAESLFAILLADALRQLQKGQDGWARDLRYPHEYALPSGEWPATLPITPPSIENGRVPTRSLLIHL